MDKCLSCSLLNAYYNRYATMVLSKFNKLLYEQFSCTKNVFVVSQILCGSIPFFYYFQFDTDKLCHPSKS